MARSLGSSPKISTSQSIGSSVCSLWPATLWKAETMRTLAPRRFWAVSAAECSGGSCTRATRGGTRGTVVSTTSLAVTCGAISSRILAWVSQGTVMMTTSAGLGGVGVAHAPRGGTAGCRRQEARAASAALSAEREPRITA